MATCPKCRVSYPEDLTVCPEDGEHLLPEIAFSGADQELQPGQQVGEYVIDEKLGEGGFGAVFRGTHPVIGKQVAIKVLFRQFSANPEMVSRFISEARAVNQIRHKNIIDIFAFGQLPDGRHYYVMELIVGQPLSTILEQRTRLALAEAVPVLRQLARALDAAHAKGIAHRDLKPENVYLSSDDEGSISAKLLDFGIAKLLTTAPHMHKTRTGAPMGTPYYMSPEQCRGRDVDHRTDIYSFGVLCFETLTGKLPFDGEDFMEILLKHLNDPPPAASSVSADLPAGVDDAIAWMLQKDPGQRPPNLTTAVKALEEGAAAAGVALPAAPAATGFVVRQSAGHAGLPSHVTPVVRPASAGGLGHAATQASGLNPPRGGAALGQSFIAAESAFPERAGKRGRMTVLFAVSMLAMFVLVAGALVFLRQRAAAGDDPASPPTEPPVVASPTDKPPVPVVEPVAAPPPPVATPALPPLPTIITIPSPETTSPLVTLSIKSNPAGADVYLDDKLLGVAPGSFQIDRSDGPRKLVLKHDDCKDHVEEITPSDNVILSVDLEKLKKRKPRVRGTKPKSDIPQWEDLE